MNNKIKILHIASHKTNIGDGANIQGFQKTLQEDATSKYQIEFINEEIMEYKPHLGDKDFNSSEFLELANTANMVVIGGGGFFSAFERFKNTGCHVDFTLETLAKIKVPIVYYALGYAVYYGQSYHNTDALAKLLKYAEDNHDRVLVSLRNDGSKARLQKHVANVNIDNIATIPDGGFYTPTTKKEHLEIDKTRMNFGLQLAGDKSYFRFKEQRPLPVRAVNKLFRDRYEITFTKNRTKALKQIAEVVEWLVNEHNGNLVLLPHIHSDLSIIDDFTHILPRDIVRFHTQIAGVYRGYEGSNAQFDLYKQLDFTMGMRFHSNVCPFGLGIPSIGLVSHYQLDGLYNELDCDDYVYLNKEGLSDNLKTKVSDILSQPQKYKDFRKQTNTQLRAITKQFHLKMLKMLP